MDGYAARTVAAYFIAIAVYAFDAGGRAENLIASRAGALRASELEAV